MPYIPMEYTVDLGKTINVTPLHTLFAMGDDNAHRFAFSVVQGGTPVDLSGCTVLATYTNFSPHGVTVNLEGKIEDGKAVALLCKACYTMEGRFALVVRLKNSVGTSSIFYGDGYMIRTTSETVIDGDYIIYDVNTLLEKIAEINEATSSANTAAQNANTAAETANASAVYANTEAQNANTAANAANASAQTADTAAGKIDDMTVSATPVDTGTATAELSTVDGHYHLSLGLPKGDTGATPRISVQVQTGAAGSEASVSVSGTAENPVIHLTIPRGDVGDIGALTINGKTPDAGGTVTLEIGDISGLSDAIANAGGVKTVAGVAPDSAGNVALNPADLGAATEEEVSSLKNDLADAWASGKTYAVGDYCISDNRLYKCKTAHTAGSAFAASYWEAVSVADMLKALSAKTSEVRLYSSADFSSNGDAITIDSTTSAAIFGRVAVIFLRFTVNSSDGHIVLPFSTALQSKQYFSLPEIWGTSNPNLGWFSLFSNKIFATSSMVYGKTYSGMFTTIVY